MFSLDNFYYVLHANFLQPYNAVDIWFDNFGPKMPIVPNIGSITQSSLDPSNRRQCVLFYDQEPMIPNLVNSLMVTYGHTGPKLYSSKILKFLANSEISEYKTTFCKENGFYDWYYFFHGLIALEWYNDYRYVPTIDYNFTKVFITLNHLVTRDRSYRLNLVSSIIERGLDSRGHISCSLTDDVYSWKDEILDPHSKLSKESKKRIYHQFSKLPRPLVLDVNGWRGDSSAKLNLPLMQSGLWHLVTETVFYYDKQHLTEKIFKPIVARRPFILVAAPGNLAYLKSYGFRTFDQWIDESYDYETDHDKRISMILDQVERLCGLTEYELKVMHREMDETLTYNFNHFYGNFKNVIITELVENYVKCLKQCNVSEPDHEKRIDVNAFNAEAVLNRLIG